MWLATGSDLGGSVRTPAGFCGVVGVRPSPGRVAAGPSPLPFGTMSVEGPMGRTVADAALMLDAMAGLDARDPLSLEASARPFADAAAAPALPVRVAYTPDLGGVTPVAADVREDDRAAREPRPLELAQRLAACEQAADAGRVAEHLVERHRGEVGPVAAEVEPVRRHEGGDVEQHVPGPVGRDGDGEGVVHLHGHGASLSLAGFNQ